MVIFVPIGNATLELAGTGWTIQEVVSLVGSSKDLLGSSNNFNVSAGQVSYDNLISNIPENNVKLALDSLTLGNEVTEVTTNYTLVYGDKARIVVMNKTGDATLTIPTNANVPYPIGTLIYLYNRSTSDVYIVGDTGVTLRNGDRLYTNQEVILRKRGTDEWVTNDYVPWLETVERTADYTLAMYDKDRVVVMNKTGDANVTVPANSSVAFPVDTLYTLLIKDKSTSESACPVATKCFSTTTPPKSNSI